MYNEGMANTLTTTTRATSNVVTKHVAVASAADRMQERREALRTFQRENIARKDGTVAPSALARYGSGR